MSRHRAQSQVARRWQGPGMLRAARGGVAVALVASGVVACATTNAPPLPRTAPVQLTSITSGVSATGALAAVTEQNLGFTKGGQLTAVNVKVGDRVTAGQVLATIDAFPAQQVLDQARAQRDTQSATLAKITNSPVVAGSQDTLDQARAILQQTQDQADATQDADDTAIDNARRQLSQAKKTLDKAEDQLKADKSACGSGSSSSGSGSTSAASTKTSGSGSSGSGSSGSGSGSGSTPTTGVVSAVSAVTQVTPPAACSQIPSDEAAVSSAKSAVVTAQGAVDAAKAKKDVDEQSGQLAVANAQQAVVSAQNALNSAASDRPSNIAAQAAQVSAAQAAVDTAQRDVDNTTLRAPVGGVVSALNGVVGEFVAPSAGTSALAPGSDAAVPGTNGAASAAVAAAAATPTRPGGIQFLILSDVDEFQAVVAYSESDAAMITSGQKVNLTFDAVPDLTATGSVVSVAPSATVISGVITYYVTVAVPKTDPRLKNGMTAQAEVLTKEIPNVLAVPSAAVHTQNGASVVTVLDPNGTQRSVPVQPGASGDGKTQILSGLRQGQQVVLPATP